MKRIIHGRKYSTDTAEFIAKNEEGFRGNYKRYYEGLYRKKTGEFFLAVNGGPLSRYGIRTVDGQLCENTGEIIPLSLEEAKEWVENNLNADSYEDLFGEVDE